jgi:hypothetical protein
VKIAVSRQSRPGGTVSKINLGIYNIKGHLIEKLTTDSRQLITGITWNASKVPPGIYLLKARIDQKTLTKKLFIIR